MPTSADRFRNHHASCSRRRVLSGLAAAVSAVAWPPPPSDAARALAQTPGATPVAPVSATPPPDASAPFRAVAEALAAAMEARGTPGAALGILAEGREEHAVFGVADIAGGEAVTAETLFQTGSITKTFTGTAVMGLV